MSELKPRPEAEVLGNLAAPTCAQLRYPYGSAAPASAMLQHLSSAASSALAEVLHAAPRLEGEVFKKLASLGLRGEPQERGKSVRHSSNQLLFYLKICHGFGEICLPASILST